MLGLHTHFDSTDKEVWRVQTTQKSTETLAEDTMCFFSKVDCVSSDPDSPVCARLQTFIRLGLFGAPGPEQHQADARATSVQLR